MAKLNMVEALNLALREDAKGESGRFKKED